MKHFFDLLNPWLVSLGVGFLPKAPGTWGSLLALVIFIGIWPSYGQGAIIFIIAAVLWFLATHRYIQATGHHDPKEVIVDEVLGLWLTLAPLLGGEPRWEGLIFGFLIFRLLDILKPGPIGWVDRQGPGVWGVMGDDLLAGLIGAFALQGAVE